MLRITLPLIAYDVLFGLLARIRRAALASRTRRSVSSFAADSLRGTRGPERHLALAGGFLVPALVGWIAPATPRVLSHAMAVKVDISVANNLRPQCRTRLAIFRRIAISPPWG